VADETTETLAEYVKRVRDEKGLSLQDVERRAHKRITSGYVSRVENGQSFNLTVDRLQALALGLGVDEDNIFAVARGVPAKFQPKNKALEVLLFSATQLDGIWQELTPDNQQRAEDVMQSALETVIHFGDRLRKEQVQQARKSKKRRKE
jgi:transcriptional regulator with XRE-family HTH domain